MTRRDHADLLLLGALWGASYLFMRMGAAEFGPAALVFVRVAGASALLLPLLAWRGQWPALWRHWRALVAVGLIGTALPFALITTAALALGAGLMSVFNATAPIWAALIAWGWLGERPGGARIAGLAIGLAGVVGLAWGEADFTRGAHGVSPALGAAACIAATVSYGLGANLSRRYLQQAPTLAVAAGSQTVAALAMALPALGAWPAVPPSPTAWFAAAALALACTALAYLLYFRLIARTGATNATSVTLLIPAFAIAWGWLFLGETPTAATALGCAVIVAGTALSTGLLSWPARRAA